MVDAEASQEEHVLSEAPGQSVKAKHGVQRASTVGNALLKSEATRKLVLSDVAHPSRIVHSKWFELTFCVFIALNAVCMAYEMQYHGFTMGHELEYPGYDDGDKDSMARAAGALSVINNFFGAVFLLELLIKMAGEKLMFWKRPWNYFDTALVALWIADDIAHASFPFRTALLRLLRFVRLLRWLGHGHVQRMKGLDALILMSTALRSSVPVLLWAVALIGTLNFMLALIFGQVMVFWIQDETVPKEDRIILFQYFGNFSRCFLTMFELALANWPPVARILQESVSEYFIIFSICHKCTIGFAVIGVVNGVFMQETLKAAHNDDILMVREAQHKKNTHVKKMNAFFAFADMSNDGGITKDEFVGVMNNQHVKSWFAAQDLSVSDVETIFDLMNHDRSDGDVLDPEEFVRGVSTLKGPAKSLDVHLLLNQQRKMSSDISNILKESSSLKKVLSELLRRQGRPTASL